MKTTGILTAAEAHKKRLKEELLKLNIKNEADLREAMQKLPPLCIGLMVDPIKAR